MGGFVCNRLILIATVMSESESKEQQAIHDMVSRDASSAYLRAMSSHVEVTILRGTDIVRICNGKEQVVGTVAERPVTAQPAQYTLR